MRLKKSIRKTIIIFVTLALIASVIILMISLVPQPPQEKVELARIALSEATSNKADTYSKNLYREAKSLYDSAMFNWQKENERFIYFRNFQKVAGFAEQSARKAEQASKTSRNNVIDLDTFLSQKIDKLNNIAGQIDKRYSSYPLSAEVWTRISKGRMLLKEAEVAFRKGDFSQAKARIADSELLLTESYDSANTHLQDYFRSFPDWKKWTDKTIRESRQNQSYSIIVDKYSRKCLVYLGGEKKYEYNVELGKNWVGDKRMKGDRATPEGMYKVVRKFGNGRTKYHKALLIDYPNETDKAEFKQEIARGTLPRSAKIGSLIEIHGDGGRGIDWTEGCIALTNSEMDVVFKIAKEGTPVTIVGSMVGLDQLPY